jgi:hypothetical protein
MTAAYKRRGDHPAIRARRPRHVPRDGSIRTSLPGRPEAETRDVPTNPTGRKAASARGAIAVVVAFA